MAKKKKGSSKKPLNSGRTIARRMCAESERFVMLAKLPGDARARPPRVFVQNYLLPNGNVDLLGVADMLERGAKELRRRAGDRTDGVPLKEAASPEANYGDEEPQIPAAETHIEEEETADGDAGGE